MGIFKLNKNSVGYDGERVAEKFLKKQGYKILERNWCNRKGRRIGEIDIVAQDKKDDAIVFVEVKSRKITKDEIDVLPEEQITQSKLNKLSRIAEVYIKENELLDANWRIDAISVLFVEGERKPQIKHIESVFL